ncbi:MAG: hypothetical protein ACYC6E_06200 [Bellilinea sp.]
MFRIFHNYLERKNSPRRRAFGRKDQDQRSEPRRHGEHGEEHRYKSSKPGNYRELRRHGEELLEEKIKIKDLNHGDMESTEKSIDIKVQNLGTTENSEGTEKIF